MIISGEPVQFEPFGRDFLNFCGEDERSSSFVVQGEKNDEQPLSIFRIRKVDENIYEEIYATGKKTVWSRNSSLLKIFSTDFAVIDAFWHSFLGSHSNGQSDSNTNWDAICVIGKKNIDIYRTHDGELFQQTLPFPVRRVHATEFGLLIERLPTAMELRTFRTSSDQYFPFLFSLSHPLNEIVPVIYKPKDLTGHETVRYTTDMMLNVVDSNLRLSFLLTFDKKSGYHSVWTVRKATKQDAAGASEDLQQSLLSNVSDSTTYSLASLTTGGLTPSLRLPFAIPSPLSQSIPGPSSSSGVQTLSTQHTTATASLSSGLLTHLFAGAHSSTPEEQSMTALTAGSLNIGSPSSLPARVGAGRLIPPTSVALTPRLASKTVVGQLQNPAVAKLIRLNTIGDTSSVASAISTPHSVIGTTPKGGLYQSYFPSPALNSYHAGDYLHQSAHVHCFVPFVPDLCLNLVWTESQLQPRVESSKSNERASKVVVVEDFADTLFFCYLIASINQLRCLKISRGTDGRWTAATQLTTIECRDVAACSDSKQMIILDQNCNLCLYSGIKKVSTLYCDAMSLLSPPDRYTSDFNRTNASRILSSSELPLTIDHPMNGTLTMDTVGATISPVCGIQSENCPSFSTGSSASGALVAVDTFCESSELFLLTLSTKRTCRCFIPKKAVTSSVQLCLDALKAVLPPDVVNDLFSSWFMNCELSSPCGSGCLEIVVFMKFLMEATGFPSLKMFDEFGLNESLAEIPAKRSKCSDDGSDSDWLNLVQDLKGTLCGDELQLFHKGSKSDGVAHAVEQLFVRNGAPYFAYLPHIFYALHCCYEEMKLSRMHWPALRHFGACLLAIAKTLQLPSYIDHYFRDCSSRHRNESSISVDQRDLQKLRYPSFWSSDCFSIFGHAHRILNGEKPVKNVTVIPCCERSWIVCVLYRLGNGEIRNAARINDYLLLVGEPTTLETDLMRILDGTKEADGISDILAKLLRRIENIGVAGGVLETFPPGIVAPLLLRLAPPKFRAFQHPVTRSKNDGGTASSQYSSCQEKTTAQLKGRDADGMAGQNLNDDLSRMLFSKDVRLLDVRQMLRSSKPCKITLKQRPGVTDNEFREEQERYLYSICVRTMTLPIGRGMLTFRSHRPLLAENAEIPKLALTGRTSGPHSLTVDLSHIDVPANMDIWAKFHNGVAAALRLASPDSLSIMDGDNTADQQLDTSWIIYNMPRSSGTTNDPSGGGGISLTPEHAGFLFGLGLNGHLTNLALFNLHEYLVRGDQMTSIALLLGMASAKCKTADLQSMKMLSTHLPFLLLPTLLELNIDPLVQTAAVLGVGLLYAESGNYRLAEALVKEIGRPPTALNDNFIDKESYALSCGFALGLITLGLGDMVFGDPNFTLAGELNVLMNGGHKRSHHYAPDAPISQLVKDGDFLNVHVTSAPAIVALGLMYLKSNNVQVASWFDPPETLALLDTVRPDFLLLRAISKSLILWDDIVPRIDWVEKHVPSVVSRFISMDDDDRLMAIREQNLDLETVSQAYCNIVAGACFAVALKFAGSANADAFECLIHYYKLFDASYQKRSPSTWRKIYSKAGRYTTENALNVIVMSLGVVMAGTGNLDVLRIVRHLRQRVGPNASNWLLHGGHMAAHIALGLLFLGGGRFTLSTSNLSIATLFCALYPKFPISPNDNRFHLQAFRHLYVLACEPRLFVTRDHITSELAYANISIKFKACKHYNATSETLTTPCILPELKFLEEVRISDDRYWPVRFGSENWEDLRSALRSPKGLEICRRAGFCTRKDDPMGYQGMVSSFHMYYDDWASSTQQRSFDSSMEILDSLRLSCAKRDCEFVYAYLVDLFELVNSNCVETIYIWQLKLLLAYRQQFGKQTATASSEEPEHRLVSMEFLMALEMTLRHRFIEDVDPNALKAYMDSREVDYTNIGSTDGQTSLGAFLTLFDIPSRSFWAEARLRDYRNLRLFLEKFISLNIPVDTAMIVHRVLGKC